MDHSSSEASNKTVIVSSSEIRQRLQLIATHWIHSPAKQKTRKQVIFQSYVSQLHATFNFYNNLYYELARFHHI